MQMLLTMAPAEEPVSLAEVKSGLAQREAGDDTLLSCLITAARVICEARTGLIFLPQVWTLFLNDWPAHGSIKLPLAPVRALTAARMTDRNGRCVGLDAGSFRLDSNCAAQYLRQAPETAEPVDHGTLEIDVSAGLANRPEDLPERLKRAVADLVVHWHTHRQPVAFGDQTIPIPDDIAGALSSFAPGRDDR
jgi:uncharacterized phiE125 gp8 family phage protein